MSKYLNVGTFQGWILRTLCLCTYTHVWGNVILPPCFKNHPYAAGSDFISRLSEHQTHEYLISYSRFLLTDMSNLMCTKTNLISFTNKFNAFPLPPSHLTIVARPQMLDFHYTKLICVFLYPNLAPKPMSIAFKSYPSSSMSTAVILSPNLCCLSLSQFSSVAQSCLTSCNPMDFITPGFPD